MTMEDFDIPASGAVFTFGKNEEYESSPSKFWIKNDVICDISCGDEHTIVLTGSGRLFAVGNNAYGQLGLQNKSSAERPYCIKALKPEKIARITCGTSHTLASSETGLIYAWGFNSDGQLGTDDSQQRDLPFQVIQVSSLPRELAAGSAHSMLLTDDGQIYVWGGNSDGQLGLDTDQESVPKIVPLEHKIIHICCGSYHSLALTEEGLVLGWGDGSLGQLGLSQQIAYNQPQLVELEHTIVMLAAGRGHTLLLTESGQILSSGLGSSGQLGRGETVVSATQFGQVLTSDKNRFVYISSSDNHSAAFTDDGYLYMWGCGSHGKLGFGHEQTSSKFSPVPVERLGHIQTAHVACGGCHTMVLGTLRSSDVTFEQQEADENQDLPITRRGYRAFVPKNLIGNSNPQVRAIAPSDDLDHGEAKSQPDSVSGPVSHSDAVQEQQPEDPPPAYPRNDTGEPDGLCTGAFSKIYRKISKKSLSRVWDKTNTKVEKLTDHFTNGEANGSAKSVKINSEDGQNKDPMFTRSADLGSAKIKNGPSPNKSKTCNVL